MYSSHISMFNVQIILSSPLRNIASHWSSSIMNTTLRFLSADIAESHPRLWRLRNYFFAVPLGYRIAHPRQNQPRVIGSENT